MLKRSMLVLSMSVAANAAFAAPETAPAPRAEAVKQKRVVLVMPFGNMTKERCPVAEATATGDPNHPVRDISTDKYSSAPRAILEDMIVNAGVSVVERQRLDLALKEEDYKDFNAFSEDKAVKLGRKLGANAIVLGTIVRAENQDAKFEGYGIQKKIKKVSCELQVRVFDVDSNEIVASKICKGAATYKYLEGSGDLLASGDVVHDIVETALEQLRDDPGFFDKLLGKTSREKTQDVEVAIEPSPANCDIEVDGNFVGNSPTILSFPVGESIKIRLSKVGYLPWEKSIAPTKGMKLTPELQKRADAKDPPAEDGK